MCQCNTKVSQLDLLPFHKKYIQRAPVFLVNPKNHQNYGILGDRNEKKQLFDGQILSFRVMSKISNFIKKCLYHSCTVQNLIFSDDGDEKNDCSTLVTPT